MLHMPREVGELTEVVRSVYNVCDSVACLAITSSLNTLFSNNSYDRIFSDTSARSLANAKKSLFVYDESFLVNGFADESTLIDLRPVCALVPAHMYR